MQALSQLSYSPTREARNVGKGSSPVKKRIAGQARRVCRPRGGVQAIAYSAAMNREGASRAARLPREAPKSSYPPSDDILSLTGRCVTV